MCATFYNAVGAQLDGVISAVSCGEVPKGKVAGAVDVDQLRAGGAFVEPPRRSVAVDGAASPNRTRAAVVDVEKRNFSGEWLTNPSVAVAPHEIDAALARRSRARCGGDRRCWAGPCLCKERCAWRKDDGTPRRVVEEEWVRKVDGTNSSFCVGCLAGEEHHATVAALDAIIQRRLERLRVVRAVVTDGTVLGRRDIEDCGTDQGSD